MGYIPELRIQYESSKSIANELENLLNSLLTSDWELNFYGNIYATNVKSKHIILKYNLSGILEFIEVFRDNVTKGKYISITMINHIINKNVDIAYYPSHMKSITVYLKNGDKTKLLADPISEMKIYLDSLIISLNRINNLKRISFINGHDFDEILRLENDSLNDYIKSTLKLNKRQDLS